MQTASLGTSTGWSRLINQMDDWSRCSKCSNHTDPSYPQFFAGLPPLPKQHRESTPPLLVLIFDLQPAAASRLWRILHSVVKRAEKLNICLISHHTARLCGKFDFVWLMLNVKFINIQAFYEKAAAIKAATAATVKILWYVDVTHVFGWRPMNSRIQYRCPCHWACALLASVLQALLGDKAHLDNHILSPSINFLDEMLHAVLTSRPGDWGVA